MGVPAGDASLIEAIRDRDVARVERLLAAGASPEETTADGVFALEAAVRERLVKAVELLLAAGADPDRKDDRGRTPLAQLAASLTACLGDPADEDRIAERLLDAGANPYALDEDGLSPHEHALRRGRMGIARLVKTRAI